MRNDSLDELDDLPSLTSDRRESAFPADEPPVPRLHAVAPAAVAPRSGPGRLLGALVGVLLLALGGLALWSQQQIARMEQQLVATQESFARISE
ncbi:MAG TPA: ATPase, partial [Pseudomonas sp.]